MVQQELQSPAMQWHILFEDFTCTSEIQGFTTWFSFNMSVCLLQGLAVSVFYCFLNGEVRATIQQRLQRWQEGRSVATKYTRASMANTQEGHGMRAGSTHSTQTAHSLLGNGKISASSSMNKDCFQNNNGKNGLNENGTTTAMLEDEALWCWPMLYIHKPKQYIFLYSISDHAIRTSRYKHFA